MNVRVRLLGDFRVVVDGRPLPGDAWAVRRPAELVKLLALAPGHRLRREQVMEALWPELEPDAMAANFHKAAHLARRSLGPDESLILASGSAALWPSATLTTDVELFESAAELAVVSGDPSAFREAASLYGGELLPDNPTPNGRFASGTSSTCATSRCSAGGSSGRRWSGQSPPTRRPTGR